ncbi:MAG: (2Fe-2S) ferredoxin domain-containing protein [Cyanobacteria bacterium J06626_14]
MTSTCEAISAAREDARPQGRVLKGKYVGAFRSEKGKLKGLRLQSGGEEYAIKLPKYLRPMLVRELMPETFIQVWAYPDKDVWRAINILPLSEAEILDLPREPEACTHQPTPSITPTAKTCIQVCRKGKCFKQGSREIYNALQAEVEANPGLQHIAIEAVGCMKACKQGPNLRVLPSSKVINRVSSNKALTILSEF